MTTAVKPKDENIVWHQHSVDKAFRSQLKSQKPSGIVVHGTVRFGQINGSRCV